MMSKGLLTQIGMVAISIGIIFTYVEPTFSVIKETQDTVVLYQEEQAKVSAVNEQLRTLVSKMENVSDEDTERLEPYIPNTVDVIEVPRDLMLITKQSGASYVDAKSLGDGRKSSSRSRRDTQASTANEPKQYSFSLSVEGTYLQLKTLFSLLEQNKYPLEVQSVDITSNEGGFLGAELTLATYAQQ